MIHICGSHIQILNHVLCARDDPLQERAAVGSDISEGLFCRWKDGWPEVNMEDESTTAELRKRLKEVKWSDGWPSENLSARTPSAEPEMKRSKSECSKRKEDPVHSNEVTMAK